MTWKFVTTWPCRSHTNPEPAPCGTSVISKKFTGRRARLVMKTTDGLQLSKSSIVAFSSEARSPRAVTGRASADGALQPARGRRDARGAAPHEREDGPPRQDPEEDGQQNRAAPPPRRLRRRVSVRGRREARHGAGARVLRRDADRLDDDRRDGAFTNAPPWLDVGVALILFTTSMPSITLPKTQ